MLFFCQILFLQVEKYTGDRSHGDLKKFAVTLLGQDEEQDERLKQHTNEPQPPIVILTSENFENAIQKGYSMVKFFAPWYAKQCFFY